MHKNSQKSRLLHRTLQYIVVTNFPSHLSISTFFSFSSVGIYSPIRMSLLHFIFFFSLLFQPRSVLHCRFVNALYNTTTTWMQFISPHYTAYKNTHPKAVYRFSPLLLSYSRLFVSSSYPYYTSFNFPSTHYYCIPIAYITKVLIPTQRGCKIRSSV